MGLGRTRMGRTLGRGWMGWPCMGRTWIRTGLGRPCMGCRRGRRLLVLNSRRRRLGVAAAYIKGSKNASARCFDRSERARGAGELPDRAGRNDGAAFRVSLVVPLEVVEVVDHQSVGLPTAAIGEIGRPIEAFHAGAVAKLER